MPTASIPAPQYRLPDGYEHVYSGKVRDLWRTPNGDLLFVATDRISAYDWVLPTPIPDKGRILTATSLWWFEHLADIVGNHVVSTDVPVEVEGRAMVCTPLQMVPVECVARGYLTGSGLLDYQRTGAVCGIELPAGLVEASKFDTPLFTPATKAEFGAHDENISFDRVVDLVGADRAAELRDLTLRTYGEAADHARSKGVILADTKFEFGLDTGGRLVLADEVLTPDSSRYWPADTYAEGVVQPSFDKQFVRNWLTGPDSGWDRNGSQPPPALPDEIVAATRDRYIEAYERISGLRFADWIGATA